MARTNFLRLDAPGVKRGVGHRHQRGDRARGPLRSEAPVLRISPRPPNPIPKAISNRSWIVTTVTIPGRTGEPLAVSSLIH